MSLLRTAGVAVVVLLLTVTLVTANAVAAAHLTVLDPDFVTDSIEEEGGYELVEEMTVAGVGGDASGEESGPVDTGALVEDAVTEEYVQSQTEANVDRTYAYLHGNEDELNLSVATGPIRENVSAGVEARLRNASLVELVAQSDAELSGPINASVIERMTDSRSSYRQVKADVRASARDRVLDAAVDRAFQDASDDELVRAAGEDPDDYTEEQKARFVRQNEPEIRAALRDRIEAERGDEIDRRVEEELATLREDATTTDAETETERAVADVQATVARGLTTDQSYEAFRENLSAAKADLAAASADRVDERLAAELPARVDLAENMGSGARQGFADARTAVVWFDRLTLVLPVGVALLVGLLYYLRGSVVPVATDAGASMVLAGLPTLVGVGVVRSRLSSMVADAPAEQQQFLEVTTGLAGRALGTAGDLALALTVGGAVLVAGSLAVRYGLLDRLRAALDDGQGPGNTGNP